MEYKFCLGCIRVNGLLREIECPLRDDCQFYPTNPRWLAEHYAETDTFGDGRVKEIVPPPYKTQKNGKEKADNVYTCPYFLPRPNNKERKTFSTPFD